VQKDDFKKDKKNENETIAVTYFFLQINSVYLATYIVISSCNYTSFVVIFQLPDDD